MDAYTVTVKDEKILPGGKKVIVITRVHCFGMNESCVINEGGLKNEKTKNRDCC